MKLGQLIEYNMRKVVHKMLWRYYSQTSFWKIKIEHISGSVVWIFIQLVFIQVDDYQSILKLICRTPAFTSYKLFFFKKKKKKERTSDLPHFLHDFWKKKLSFYILLLDQILVWLPLLVRYWTICVW